MAPINTTDAFAYGYATITDAAAVMLEDFTGIDAADISRANRAVVSVSVGNVHALWTGDAPTDVEGGGIAFIGSPATDVASTAVFVVDGGNNLANLQFIKANLGIGGTLDPYVSVILEE